jgi:hypothetical protein
MGSCQVPSRHDGYNCQICEVPLCIVSAVHAARKNQQPRLARNRKPHNVIVVYDVCVCLLHYTLSCRYIMTAKQDQLCVAELLSNTCKMPTVVSANWSQLQICREPLTESTPCSTTGGPPGAVS